MNIKTKPEGLRPESNEDVKYTKFIDFVVRESHQKVRYTTLERFVSVNKDADGIVTHDYKKIKLLRKKISLNVEALPYILSLDGCPQKLLMYLLAFELNVGTGIFLFNGSVISKFIEFCKLCGISYKEAAVKQAIKALSSRNAVLSIERGKYRMNPMITGGHNEYSRKKLVNDYSLDLDKKGLSTDSKFYPAS